MILLSRGNPAACLLHASRPDELSVCNRAVVSDSFVQQRLNDLTMVRDDTHAPYDDEMI